MSEVTQLLEAIDRGESQAAEELLPLVYEELRFLTGLNLEEAARPCFVMELVRRTRRCSPPLIGSSARRLT